MKKNEIIISIESAIQGGSLSILIDGQEVDYWVGEKSVSKSEDLLDEISNLLKKNSIEKNNIKFIAVSDSVGSYTGIRIGLATALGLGKAFNESKVIRVSILFALAQTLTEKGRVVAAVSNNNRDIFIQTFESFSNENNFKKAVYQIIKINNEDFCAFISRESPFWIVTNEKFYEYITENDKLNHIIDLKRVKNAGKNLAKCIGMKVFKDIASDNNKT